VNVQVHLFDLFSSSRQVMRSLGLNPTNKEISDLIAEVDKNGKWREVLSSNKKQNDWFAWLGNQRLDFPEFVTFMSKHWHERDQEAELRDAFRLFDRDNSGFITINELKQVMLNMGEKLNQEELEDMMREVEMKKFSFLN
jgi:calmodulin